MKNLLSFMLCFSLLLFVSNGVNATEDHSPPGIEMQYDMVNPVSIDVENSISFESPGYLAVEPIHKSKINKGGLFTFQLWPVAEKCIINNKITGFDNSLYALNHLLYEAARTSGNCNQRTKPASNMFNDGSILGLEIVYNQGFLLS